MQIMLASWDVRCWLFCVFFPSSTTHPGHQEDGTCVVAAGGALHTEFEQHHAFHTPLRFRHNWSLIGVHPS